MRVELDIYSGRPNPSWQLDEADVHQVLDRFAGRALALPNELPNRLGYRGLVLSTTSDDEHVNELPNTFALGEAISVSRAAGAANPLSRDEVADAVRWLLGTANDAIGEVARRHTEEVLAGTFAEQQNGDTAPPVETPHGCEQFNTPFNPEFWNDAYVCQNNNCYNYAVDLRTDTFAQPGRQCEHEYSEMTCTALEDAAECDGIAATCSGQNRLTALVIWDGEDYHWYRYHSNGFWGHKPGHTVARNYDNCDQIIGGSLNPANCCRGPYTIFCGYFWVPRQTVIR